MSDTDLLPAAIIPIIEIGLQTFDKENNLAVDAAKVNPSHAKGGDALMRKQPES